MSAMSGPTASISRRFRSRNAITLVLTMPCIVRWYSSST